MTFGQRLRTLREERELTQLRLAELSGVGVATLRNHEQGLRLPSLPHAVQLARALGVTVDVLTACDEMAPPAPQLANDGKKGVRG